MKIKSIVALIVCWGFAVLSYGMGEKTHGSEKKLCLLCAGQSNADGRVPVSELPASISLPLEHCLFSFRTSDGSFSPLTAENYLVKRNKNLCWAFDLVVYNELCKAKQRDIYVIKHTLGGTSIDKEGGNRYHWTADYKELEDLKYSLLFAFEKQIEACVKQHGKEFEIGAVLWHQGEGDSNKEEVAARYYQNLKKVIKRIRKVVGNAKLPFITGTVSHASTQYNKVIEEAQRRLAAEDPYFYLVDMSKGTLLDPYHFDAKSTLYFGKSAYNCLIDAGVVDAAKVPTE